MSIELPFEVVWFLNLIGEDVDVRDATAMRIRGPIAQRIHDAPDGASVQITVDETP